MSLAHTASKRFWQCLDALPVEIQTVAYRNFAQLKADPNHPLLHFKTVEMVDFIAFESVGITAHSACPCQTAAIGFGSGHMATMTSSSANKLLVADAAAAGFQLRLYPPRIASSSLPKPQVQDAGLNRMGCGVISHQK